MHAILDSFSGAVADLKPKDRTAENVLAVLRRSPRVSCFDMSEIAWLRDCISQLERAGMVRANTECVSYPWIHYEVIATTTGGQQGE